MSNNPSPNEKSGGESSSPAGGGGGDWRASVEQSFRNAQVREIAQTLASLEPGTVVSSKLRLAMQFEDVIFKAATSVADYQKRLTKRLKKVSKSYVPTSQAAQAHSQKEQVLTELRVKYKEPIEFILKHASKAVQEMLHKHGKEKALQLKQHTDGVKSWALDLGLDVTSSKSSQAPNVTMSDEHLERLSSHLERRLESIRAHVVKLADPDRFLVEQLQKVEKGTATSTSTAATDPEAAQRTAQILSDTTRRRYGGLHRTDMKAQELLENGMQELVKPIPLPTRNQRNDERAALKHLEKMRAASTVFCAFLGSPERAELPKNVLTKANQSAVEGIEFVVNVMRQHRKDLNTEISLEDAWMKTLVYTPAVDATAGADLEPTAPEKRARTSRKHTVMRSKVLLTPGRKTPFNLLAALRRKRAVLVRPPPTGQGSHICMVFGTAFVMKIYLVPLVVTIRACQAAEDAVYETTLKTTSVLEDAAAASSASWTPLHAGLTATKSPLAVWGAKGDYETVGSLVETRLVDASVHATYVLRKCFGAHYKESARDFEMEILEATALLEFLQLARTTYFPSWKDDVA